MNYSEMSDFEINRAVALANGYEVGNDFQSILDEFDPGCVNVIIGRSQSTFNPCNSWADAGPIIEKHMICLAADVFAEPQDGGRWVSQPAYGWFSETVRHNNPLRAAMIVFLQTREQPDA